MSEINDRVTPKQFLWAGRIIAFGLDIFVMATFINGFIFNTSMKPDYVACLLTLVPLAGLITSWWK
jgi:hypothetical protein